jgi:hypothetical protein
LDIRGLFSIVFIGSPVLPFSGLEPTPPAGPLVDHIRKQGNLATHQLVVIPEKDATELLTFVEMLLRLVFDFPSKVPGA